MQTQRVVGWALGAGMVLWLLTVWWLSTTIGCGCTTVDSNTEVTAENVSGPIQAGSSTDVSMRVVTADGDPLEDGTVILQPGTAGIGGNESHRTAPIGENGWVSFDDVTGLLEDDQIRGRLLIDIAASSAGPYEDERQNPDVVVFQGG